MPTIKNQDAVELKTMISCSVLKLGSEQYEAADKLKNLISKIG